MRTAQELGGYCRLGKYIPEPEFTEIDWQTAQWRYQVHYAESRKPRDGVHGFLTLSFSVPLGPFGSGDGPGEATPGYAVYITLDFIEGLATVDRSALWRIANALKAHINDLRFLAAGHLAIEAIREVNLKSEELQKRSEMLEKIEDPLLRLIPSSVMLDSVCGPTIFGDFPGLGSVTP